MNAELEYDESHEDFGITNRFAYEPLQHPCDAYEAQQDCPSVWDMAY